ncbi:MAG: hypothetical protein IH944_01825 [Armatimonadetes bacterium]|nr:hypothetical protein [Armatimonadota bacterium]
MFAASSTPRFDGAGLAGALLGATIGAKKLKPLTVQRVLAAVLFIASMKMVYQYGFSL